MPGLATLHRLSAMTAWSVALLLQVLLCVVTLLLRMDASIGQAQFWVLAGCCAATFCASGLLSGRSLGPGRRAAACLVSVTAAALALGTLPGTYAGLPLVAGALAAYGALGFPAPIRRVAAPAGGGNRTVKVTRSPKPAKA